MTKQSAKIISHEEFDREKKLKCPDCGWKGLPEGNIEIHERLMDVACPKCDKMILIVSFEDEYKS